MAKRLTALAVANLKPRATRYEVPDGSTGLRCVVQPSGARGWCVRFRRPDKRPAKLTLDPSLSLAAARIAAAAALHDVAAGKDPAALKRAAKATAMQTAAEVAVDTVERLANDFIEKYAKRRTRLNTLRQTEHVLRDIVLPAWRGRTVHEIRRRDVVALVEHVAEGRPIQANRTLAVLSKFFKWMMARDVIVASPVAGVARPAKEIARDRSLSDHEIKALWLACDAVCGPMAPCIKVLLLTGQRRSEVAGMRWDEIAGELWSLPASRVKNNRPHSVPLSRQVLAIIEAMPRIGDHVFTVNSVTPLTSFSGFKREVDAVITLSPPFVWHDLRRTCAAGLQRLGVRVEVIERTLNHRSGAYRGVAGVYQVDAMDEARRDALQRWADHVDAIVRGEPVGKVVRLRGSPMATKVGPLAESPDQRRRALALLVSAVRTYGPLDDDEETEAEFKAFLRTGATILDIPLGMLEHISSDEVVAAMLAEDREKTTATPKRGPGRPPTPHKHAWITYTIEAYRSVPMRRKAAIHRAAEKWELAPSFINEIYGDKKLPKPKSKAVREFFSGDTVDDVDEMIRRYRESERE